MILVTFITDRFGPHADEAYVTATQTCALTFRELIEALDEMEEYSDEWAASHDHGYEYVMTSIHLSDKRRARYWKKAVSYVRKGA